MKRAVRLVFCVCGLLLATQVAIRPAGGTAEEASWKFVVLCDTRSNPCDADGGVHGVNAAVLGRIAVAVAAEKPDVVLVPGDLILGNGYTCKPPQPAPDPPENQFRLWRQVLKPVYDTGARVLPLRGNHEMDRDAIMSDWSSCRKRQPVEQTILNAYRAVFNDSYIPANGPGTQKGLTYSLSHKNALFVGLDETTDQFQVDQKWFDKVLAKDKRTHLFVFGHYPAYAVKHKDCLACYGRARNRFWDAIGNAGGRLYFCGHDHFYDRAAIPDAKGHLLQQVLVGNGGAPFSSDPDGYPDPKVRREEHIENAYGYVVVSVKGREVSARLKVLDPSGVWRNADAFCYLAPRR
jgi:hypothetical protein